MQSSSHEIELFDSRERICRNIFEKISLAYAENDDSSRVRYLADFSGFDPSLNHLACLAT